MGVAHRCSHWTVNRNQRRSHQQPHSVALVRAGGVTVRSPQGDAVVTQLNIHHLCEVAEMKQPFDLVYVVTKAYDARWHCELIKPLLAPDGLAVGLQNGMTLDDMADVLGAERTFASAIEIGRASCRERV